MREAGHLVVLVSSQEEPCQHKQPEGLSQQTPNRHHLPGKRNKTAPGPRVEEEGTPGGDGSGLNIFQFPQWS